MAVFTGCGGGAKEKPQPAETIRGLRTEVAQLESIPDEIEAPGRVVSRASAQIAARVMGSVVRVAAREGDRVKRGQLLVVLDDRELVARRNAADATIGETAAAGVEAARALAAAQAQASLAKKTYDRFLVLREEKSISPQEFDEVEAKHRAAAASFEEAQAHRQEASSALARAESERQVAAVMASYSHVVAPFDGVVVRRIVDPGTVVSPGMPLLIVEDDSRYRLEVAVPASAGVGVVRLGSPARVRWDALPGQEFTGRVVELEAGARPDSETIQARIELPTQVRALRSGLFGRAWFRRGERKAVVIPARAVVERGQLRGVYVLDAAQVLRWRLVTTGGQAGDRVEILSGLDAGERYVADPGDRELDNKQMEAAR